MGNAARKIPQKATYQDLLEVPDDLIAQIIDGELVVSPRRSMPHADASSGLGGEIRVAFGRKRQTPDHPGGWWILDEPELHLGEDILVPDLAGWRRERLPRIPDAAYLSLAPDWICEILSPSNAHIDRARKMPLYAREKIPFLWLVDPSLKTLEVYRLEGPHWLLLSTFHGDALVHAIPFDAIELDLMELWLEAAGEPER